LSVLLVGVVSSVLAVTAFMDIQAVQDQVVAEQEWLAAGGRVLVVTDKGGSLSMAACDRLRALDGVDAAFGIRRREGLVSTLAAPGAAVSASFVSSGVAAFLREEVNAEGVIVGDPVRQQIGSGRWLTLRAHVLEHRASEQAMPQADPPLPTVPVRISGYADLSVLGDAYSYGLLLPSIPVGPAEACFVRAKAGARDGLRDALPAALGLAGPKSEPAVAYRLDSGKFTRDPLVEYSHRTTRHLPLYGGIVVAVMWLLIRWMRRSQDGLYTTLGATPIVRATVRGVELACVLAISASVGLSIAIAAAVGAGAQTTLALQFGLRAMVLTAAPVIVAALAWTAASVRADATAALKDR
jgi:hypothetical protein